MYASFDSNTKLGKYFAQNVQLSRDETKKIKEKVIPVVNDILKEIHDIDSRFGPNPVCVGSSFQGLKVDRADEFDFSVPLLNIGDLHWGTAKPRYYTLNDPTKNFESNPDGNLRVVATNQALPSPGTGYCPIRLGDQTARLYGPLVFQGDLIPLLVKVQFKMAFMKAVKNLEIRGMKSKVVHGPALTIKLQVNNGVETIPVSIDFSPIVNARMPFTDSIKWPRSHARWPSQEKINKIKAIGLSFVAKQNLNWYYSFVECEKELVIEIDKEQRGVQGQRKKIHRILKGFYETTWSDDEPDQCILSSYMIKNTWFWECEKYPTNEEWKDVRLTERFQSCVMRLKEFLRSRRLPLYFHPDVNLLAGKNEKKLDAILQKIEEWPEELNEI